MRGKGDENRCFVRNGLCFFQSDHYGKEAILWETGGWSQYWVLWCDMYVPRISCPWAYPGSGTFCYHRATCSFPKVLQITGKSGVYYADSEIKWIWGWHFGCHDLCSFEREAMWIATRQNINQITSVDISWLTCWESYKSRPSHPTDFSDKVSPA